MNADITIIKVPQLGVNDPFVTLVTWYVSEGARVEKGDSICAIETTKVAIDIESDHAGYIALLVEEGKKIPLFTPIAIIGESITAINKEKERYLSERSDNVYPEDTSSTSNVKATKKAKELALKHNIDLAGINSDGIITKKDVTKLIEAHVVKDQNTSENYHEIESSVELIGNRKAGKELMLESLSNIPQSYVEKEIVTSEIDTFINNYADNKGKYITLLSVILYCLGKALKRNKIFNSYRENNTIFTCKRINVGIIINNDNRISIPVIKDIDQLTPLEIVKKLFSMRKDIMRKKPNIDDLIGGTFTVSAMNHTEVKRFIPIVHPKQAAILAVPKVQKKFEITSDGEVSQVDFMNLGLSFDHTFLNAVHAIEFLNSIEDEIKLFLTAP